MAKPPRRAPKPVASQGAAGIRIRMYRVGFGDFFLMSVPAGGQQAHILIDCGVHAHDIGAMGDALKLMKADTGGKLALVIMTHRHADHISGFASGKAIFDTMTVEQVWMPWFEKPEGKAAAVQEGITKTATRLAAAFPARAALSDDERQYQRMAGNILGITAGGDALALQVLHSFKTQAGTPTPVGYYAAGETAALPPILANAGLTASVLGPPTDLALVAQMDNAAHQYLTEDEGDADTAARAPFDDVYAIPAFDWPTGRRAPEPLFTIDDIVNRVDSSQPALLAAAAKSADNAINNQSLVVLFTFAGKSLLFCGDAQWGNWANFLFGGPFGTPGHTGLTKQSADILGKLDFLKVGHHGSTNATPIDVVKALNSGCAAMCSTDPGAYGNPDKGTEVPRIPLLDALDAKINGRLARSDQVAAGTKTVPDPQTVPPLKPLAPPFVAGQAGKYIDYVI